MFLTLILFLILNSCSCKNLKKYGYLKEPQIRNAQKQKMITVTLDGDPNIVGGKAFKALFNTFYQLKRKVNGMKISAPIARWPKPWNTPKNEWTGIYGLPVPEEVTELPEQDEKSDIKVKIEFWEYGDIAEILHIGSYSNEAATVEKLNKFIDIKGYKIIQGSHEEEYIKGPGMFFKWNPDKYQTIIRYRIEKK
ncbi:MAG: GyrI-like domain-containing protein [Candidatus Firestonebacteria bacterium]|nr:GyrI-like domain-containing protein [Candidatus Firestonebacteria bacterium]